MSQIQRILCIAVLSAVALVWFSGLSAAQTLATSLLGFHITFDGIQYDPTANQTKFTYTVAGTSHGGSDPSRFAIALCMSQSVVVSHGGTFQMSLPGGPQFEGVLDPDAGLVWITFEAETSASGHRTLWFTLQGEWDVADILVAFGVGPNVGAGWLAGPACKPAACNVQYTINHTAIRFRAMQPGVYASQLAKIHLQGTGAVKLGFSEFSAVASLDNPMAPHVQVDYSLGDTLQDAEAYGWFPLHEWNVHEVDVPQGVLQNGVNITVWARFTIGSHNYSSDYEGRGKVSLKHDCL